MKEKKKPQISNVLLVSLVAGLLLLCAGAQVYLHSAPAPGATARITVDGILDREIDLSRESAERQFEIVTPRGKNVIAVKNGAIRVIEADCPDQICVKCGWLAGGLTPIVCLPHGLVIELRGGGDIEAPDAISG